jgi:hypothetical protein
LPTSIAEWPQLLALVGIVTTVTLAVSGFACWLLWKAWSELGCAPTSTPTWQDEGGDRRHD